MEDNIGDENVTAEAAPDSLSVSELNEAIKYLLANTLTGIWVLGEACDLTVARSGHAYFSLRDDHSRIKAIVWKGTAARLRRSLGRDAIVEGDLLLCRGSVDIYPQHGSYQLIVDEVVPQGLGRLQREFERMRGLLEAEGLFAAERKRPLPSTPRRIAVITSPQGAAIRDFLRAAGTRFAGTEVLVIPASVQGEGSAASLVRAIGRADRLLDQLDVLVITRGGGSLEDLWSFNEESVVRAIANCRLPVVSGVGHEVDVTLCDLVADVRALTPTDAANVALPDARGLSESLSQWRDRLGNVMRSLVATRRQQLAALMDRPIMTRPAMLIETRMQTVDDWEQRLSRAIERTLDDQRARLQTESARLSALSPLQTLARGFTVTTRPDGTLIRDAGRLVVGDRLLTRFSDGHIESTVSADASSDSER